VILFVSEFLCELEFAFSRISESKLCPFFSSSFVIYEVEITFLAEFLAFGT